MEAKEIAPIKIRENDIELRSCDKHLMLHSHHTTAELIKWVRRKDEPDFCYTIAYWIRTSEGYDLQFVGSRPFECDAETFWYLAKVGQKHLDEQFES